MRLRTSSSVRTKMTRQLYAQDALRLRNVTMALRQYALTASPVNACLPEAPRHRWLVRKNTKHPKQDQNATIYTTLSNAPTTQVNNAKNNATTFNLLLYLTTKKPGATMTPLEKEKSKIAEIIKDPSVSLSRYA